MLGNPNTLSSIAKAIWDILQEDLDNQRASGATTIAVVRGRDQKLYCTSNDVSKITDGAIAEAKKQGIKPIGRETISQSGAGFHAEMWAVIQAMHADEDVSKVLSSVGASRACCKQCSAVLKLLKVNMEQESETEYASWYNPITVGEDSQPRPGFEQRQRKNIPDQRNFGKNLWWIPNQKGKTQDHPPDSAK